MKFMTIVFLAAIPLAAQQASAPANPAPGCMATQAELEANKKVVLEFFRTTGEARVALADPSYIQHNPAFKKRAEDNHVSDYQEYKDTFLRQAGGRGPANANAARPPQGNPLEIVTAECDLVTVIHKNFRQDPTSAPGKFYEAFTFDTFRVKNGKLVEHWDANLVPAPDGK